MPLDQVVQYGLAGVVLAWFMVRADHLLTELTKGVNANTNAIMLLAERVGPRYGWDREGEREAEKERHEKARKERGTHRARKEEPIEARSE